MTDPEFGRRFALTSAQSVGLRKKRGYLIFENVGLWALLLYWLTTLINDPIVLYYGQEGVLTPRQVAVVISIMITIPSFGLKSLRGTVFARSIPWLVSFFLVSAVSYTFFAMIGRTNLDHFKTLVATGANVLWLIVVGAALSKGLSPSDKKKLVRSMLLIGMVPLVTGLYESVTQQHLLSGGFADRGLGSFFWVRGLHVDKVDFVSALAPGVFLAYLLLGLKGWLKMWYLLLYFAAGLALSFYSFSTTGMLGLVGGIFVISLLYQCRGKRIGFTLVVLCVVAILATYIVGETDMGRFLTDQYTDKYERQSHLENNPRYVYGAICVREFLESPLWGIGFGNHVMKIYHETGGWAGGGNAHSVLSILADLGLLGAAPFFFFFGYLYYHTWRSVLRYSNSQMFYVDRTLLGLVLSMSVFVLAKFAFYFHALADPTVYVWLALTYAIFGFKRSSSRDKYVILPDTTIGVCGWAESDGIVRHTRF